jgi:UPF0755 protein
MRISTIKFISTISIFFLACFLVMFFVAIQAPSDFPSGQFDISVEPNSSLTSISNSLANKKIISSPFLFKVISVLSNGRSGVYAGDYRFTEPTNLISVALRISQGDQGLPRIKITIPEGTNVSDMAYIYMTKLTNFNAPKFVALARAEEGYLFPDTYYFLSNAKPEEVIKQMKTNFESKINTIKTEIDKSNRSLKDIITMASIIEEEARGYEDKRMVSGVLWKRLKEGMLLQVDAPFYFIMTKTSGVTYDDLKIDSPYNTYKYKGLPKGPISNPGIESIRATVNPLPTNYLYYLTGRDGLMHYATTYDGHLRNKNIYLD